MSEVKYFVRAVLSSGAQLRRWLRGPRPVSRTHRIFALALAFWLAAGSMTSVVVARQEPSPQKDCWGAYQTVLMAAWDEYDKCCADTAWNSSNPQLSIREAVMGRMGCRISYLSRAESAWFQFLACSSIPDWKP